MSELGDLLRAAREKKGVTLADAEEATRIRRRYLEALETGEERALPARVYVEGFVRGYASYLGLSPQDALAVYRRQDVQPAAVPPVGGSIRPVRMPVQVSVTWILLVLILGALVVLALLLSQQARVEPPASIPPAAAPTATSLPSPTALPREPALTPTPAVPTPTPVPTVTATPTPVPTVQVQVRITDRAWLRVSLDGTTAFEGMLEPGDVRTWVARERVTVLSGNAGGTEVVVNGVPKGPLGLPGHVVEVTWTQP